MTRRILIAMALLVSATGHSQVGYNDNPDNGHGHQNRNKYYEKVQKLDSVIGFLKDNGSGSDVKDYVFIYNYSRGKDVPGEVVKLGLPERTKINRQLYSYTSDGFKTRYLYQEWIGDVWQDRMLVEYFPDDYGKLDRELFSGPGTTGTWIPYQQHFYSYDYRGRIALYLRKMVNIQKEWYDFSENIWTFGDDDRLLGRMEKRVADDYIIWTEVYNYGVGDKPTERIRQTMRFDPVLRYNVLTNDNRQLYFYDEFNDPVITEQYKWIGGEWVYVGKSHFYYSFIPGRKVMICHNGHTISVAPQAVRAHLAHGDRIGPCEEVKDKEKCISDGTSYDLIREVKVYPNPASGSFELDLPGGHPFSTAFLISGDGRVVRSTEVGSAVSVTFNTAGLMSGRYILRLVGESKSGEVIVIIK